VRRACGERNAERPEGEKCGILKLAAAGSIEKAEGGVVADAEIEGEARGDLPGILRVEAEALDALREMAVAAETKAFGRWAADGSATNDEVDRELIGIREIESGVFGEGDEIFGIVGEAAIEDGLMDEVDAEALGVMTGDMGDVVAKLVFLLVADDGKGGDGGDELIVAERFEAGDGLRGRTERKGESEAEIGIARFGAVEAAGFEVETLLTEAIGEFSMNLPMWHFLEEHGYNTSLRGEQTYCVAVKRPGLPVTRYPKFLYAE